MKYKILIIFCCTFWINTSNAQDWIFEYESSHSNLAYSSWNSNLGNNTIHGIQLNRANGIRRRLIELNENGELVSFFQGTGCNVNAQYYPYGLDSIISVSRKCNGKWINTFNLFNSSGKKILTKEFENKLSQDEIISCSDGISILRQDINLNKTHFFHLIELSIEGASKKDSFSFASITDDSYEARIKNSLKTKNGDYLLSANIYQANARSIITRQYPKAIFIRGNKILWIKSFKGAIKTIEKLIPTDDGFIIHGKDEKGKLTIIIIDNEGNIEKEFKPKVLSGGKYSDIFYFEGRLFLIDKMIRGKSIFLYEVDLSAEKQIWSKKIQTDYNRLLSLRIGKVDDNHLLITGGGFKESPYDGPSTGFIMKITHSDKESDSTKKLQASNTSVEDLVNEISNNVQSVRVYPNPARFRVIFELLNSNTQNKHLLNIFNMQGKLMKSKEFFGSQIEMDISLLPSGVYLYTISAQNEQKYIQGKFIVQ